jgi:zinc transport system ATP-binding protein
MAGIDQAAQESLMALLEQAKAQMGLTLIMVSHNLRSIIVCCDQLACVNRTLHYHDRPAGLSRETLLHVFQCDVDAMLDTHLHE